MAGNKPFNKQQAEPRERDPQVAGLKVPPHSIEAEQSVLGGLMLDNERWDDVAERVVADDFYTRPHRHIFTEMARLQESGSPIDLITLAESLERQGQLDSVGGFAYLAELSKNTPSAANISAYADIVRERAVVREMISVANEIAEAGFDPQGRTSEDLLDLAESRVFKIAESRANKDEGPKNIADVLDMTAEEALAFFDNLPRIRNKIATLVDVGLGYIKLGQSATTLSGGEAQRVKLATELSRRATGRTFYILDEPTTGLHMADVHKLIEVLQRLVDAGNTVLVIEHNLDVIKVADYIVDLGPEGGSGGGQIVACGTPEQIAACPESFTGQYLKKLLK